MMFYWNVVRIDRKTTRAALGNKQDGAEVSIVGQRKEKQ